MLVILSLTSWNAPAFIVCILLFLLFVALPMNSAKTAFDGAFKASDPNTRAVMRFLPLILMLIWPAKIILFLDLAGGVGYLNSATAEAVSSALFTVSNSLFYLLWSARDSEEISAAVAIELHKVEQKSHAADARNDAKRSFMRYIFHELRVPLNAIVLGLQDMAESAVEVSSSLIGSDGSDTIAATAANVNVTQSLASSVATTANILHGNALAMGKLLDDFLSLEKIEEGKFELEPVVFRVHEMVKDATRMFAAPCAAKGLTLVANSTTPVPESIRGDVHKLRQVLCNYISNAIKFSPHGATITVSTMTLVDSTQPDNAVPFITFSVSDQGVGISKEDQAKLFQPFNQIKAGANQKGNGTGLGLSICKRIIELSGGRVGCESQEGKGSRFFFQVPVDGPSAVAAPPAAPPLSAAPPSAAPPAAADQGGSSLIEVRVLSSGGSSPLSSPSNAASPHSRSSSSESKATHAAPVEAAASRRSSASSVRVPLPLSPARIAPSPDHDASPAMPPLSIETPGRASRPPPVPKPHAALSVNTDPTDHASTGSTFFAGDDLTSRNSRALLMASTASFPSTPAMSYRPAADSDATDMSISFRSEAASTISVGQIAGLTISTPNQHGGTRQLTHAVVVDDVKSNRDLFGRMLQRRGVSTIYYAEDGVEAVALLDNLLDADLNRIQAWFLDKEMPNCDGHECAELLRARGVTAPLFGVTGNALGDDRRQFIAAGVNAVITKPVSMDAIDAALNQHGLRLSSSSRSSTPAPRRA